ncbi:hypothetical protein WA026_007994 [Henosepilachna vigintioctopunctata]|uniref:carbonic anhydrase n=1 Tax=Henosepilachna vigintioctopunctata TaxID=420089 RepID=A0AAW1TJK4_9CUCU
MKTPCRCKERSKKSAPEPIFSPIDLNDEMENIPEEMKEPFAFVGREKMLCTEIMNDGNQITIRFCPKQSPVVIGGGLSHKEYIIDRIDFHWASAHTINRERFPLETHILMYCTEYSGIDEALLKEGAAALSIMHDFADRTSPSISKLLTFIPHISKAVNKPVPYCVISLDDYLPNDTKNYWRYTGSTTDEPVKHGLEWTVFEEMLPLTRIDLGTFTNIFNEVGNLVVSNYKGVQPLPQNAQVYKNSYCCGPSSK